MNQAVAYQAYRLQVASGPWLTKETQTRWGSPFDAPPRRPHDPSRVRLEPSPMSGIGNVSSSIIFTYMPMSSSLSLSTRPSPRRGTRPSLTRCAPSPRPSGTVAGRRVCGRSLGDPKR